jgi:hypothetical protein
MKGVRPTLGALKAGGVRYAGIAAGRALRARASHPLRDGVTVVTVNWNSLHYLERMLQAVRAMSPRETDIVVVDNGSTDGSREFLRDRSDLRTMLLPTNLGHGLALDIAVPGVSTTHLAVLDVDAFPVSNRWLEESIGALDAGAQVAGARLHRNFVHPSFLVTRTDVVRRFGLTFRPVGSLRRLSTSAPLFLDVGEALSQRLVVKYGGGSALHFFEATSVVGPGLAGSVFGGLVYHNLYGTQGEGREAARQRFDDAFAAHLPMLHPQQTMRARADGTGDPS